MEKDLIRFLKRNGADSIEIVAGDYVIKVQKKNKEKQEDKQQEDKHNSEADVSKFMRNWHNVY